MQGHHLSPPSTRLTAGVALLLHAYDSARATGEDPWRFALEIDRLRTAGMSNTGLRWLLLHGLAEQGIETTTPDSPRRTFRKVPNLGLPPGSCFVLTEAGAAFARTTVAGPEWRPTGAEEPSWDGKRRAMWLGDTLVKRFRQPSPVQELILAAFEEEGWPPRIDDPLPPVRGLNPGKRLNNAIRNLNRGQKDIHFEGGGDGKSIGWRKAGKGR
jgi:hypothetical protein